jgi:hypothetical protein
MIRFSIGGRTVEPEKLEDALMAAVLKELGEREPLFRRNPVAKIKRKC